MIKRRILGILLCVTLLASMLAAYAVSPALAGEATTTLCTSTSDTTGMITSGNVLANAANIWVAGGGGGGIASHDKGTDTFTKLTNGTLFTDVYAPTHTSGASRKFYFQIDMTKEYNFTAFMLTGSATEGVVGPIKVYIGSETVADIRANNSTPTYIYEGNLGSTTASFTPTTNGELAVRADFDGAKKGRYLVVEVVGAMNGSRKQCWISEIAALGEEYVEPAPTYPAGTSVCTDTTDTTGMITSNNVLADAASIWVAGGGGGGVANYDKGSTNFTMLTNGKLFGDDGNGFVVNHGSAAGTSLYYQIDMTKEYSFTAFMLAGLASEGVKGPIKVYIGSETVADIRSNNSTPDWTYDGALGATNASFTPTTNGELAVRADFATPLVGRYLVVQTTGAKMGSKYYNWLTEIAALGEEYVEPAPTYPAGTSVCTDTTDTTGMITSNNILADAASIWVAGGGGGGIASHDKGTDTFTKLTNGTLFTDVYAPTHTSGASRKFYFQADMTKDYSFTSFMLAGSATEGVVGPIKVYIGSETVADIRANNSTPTYIYEGNLGSTTTSFTPTTHGELAVRADFDEVKIGRYLVVEVEGAINGSNKQCWISEIAALGEEYVEPEVTEKKATSVTDAHKVTITDNVLASAAGCFAYHSSRSATLGGQGSIASNFGKITDGALFDDVWVYNGHASKNGFYLQFDMGREYNFTSFMLAGGATDGVVSPIKLFVGSHTAQDIYVDNTIQPDYTYEGGLGATASTKTPTDDGTLAIQANFKTALTGRYLVVYVNGVMDNDKYRCWLSEVAASGTTTGDILCTDATDTSEMITSGNVLADAQEFTAYNKGLTSTLGGQGAAADNFAKLTDGALIDECWMVKGHTSVNGFYFQFDMGDTYVFESVMVAGGAVAGANAPVKVYIGGQTAQEIYTSNTAAVYSYADGLGPQTGAAYTANTKNGALAVRYDFAEPQLGRYLVVYVSGGKMNNNYYTWISEIAALGTPLPNENLLDTAEKADGGRVVGDLSVATDGLIYGINTEDTTIVSFKSDNTDPTTRLDGTAVDKTGGTATPVFRFPAATTVKQLMIVGSAMDQTDFEDSKTGNIYDNRHVLYFEVYAGHDQATLFDAANRIHVQDNSGSPKLMNFIQLDTPVTCRFVGFKLSCGAYQYARVSELAVYGDQESARESLIAGKQPVEAYIAEVKQPATLLNEFVWVDPPQNMTDGNYDSRTSWAHRANDGRLFTAKEREYISVTTPWTVLVYHLGGTATVDTIEITSTGEDGQYYIGGADFYVGSRLDTLLSSQNRVYTTGGEKTVANEMGDPVLDPAYDTTSRWITATLDTPVEGRYVAVVITRPHFSTKMGYSISRISEIDVYGNLPANKVEVIPSTTFTEDTYGATVDVNPLNYDDFDFIRGLDRVEIVRTKATSDLLKPLCNNWLKLPDHDRYVYEVRLIRKDGTAVTPKEFSDRTLDIRIPNDSGIMQGVGVLAADGTVNRVVNSRTDDGVLIGDQVAGLEFVRLTFVDDGVIWSGVAGTDSVN